ncbi:MAG: hypothetical protein OHK0017_07670 [Patescibacteria group bacterium]
MIRVETIKSIFAPEIKNGFIHQKNEVEICDAQKYSTYLDLRGVKGRFEYDFNDTNEWIKVSCFDQTRKEVIKIASFKASFQPNSSDRVAVTVPTTLGFLQTIYFVINRDVKGNITKIEYGSSDIGTEIEHAKTTTRNYFVEEFGISDPSGKRYFDFLLHKNHTDFEFIPKVKASEPHDTDLAKFVIKENGVTSIKEVDLLPFQGKPVTDHFFLDYSWSSGKNKRLFVGLKRDANNEIVSFDIEEINDEKQLKLLESLQRFDELINQIQVKSLSASFLIEYPTLTDLHNPENFSGVKLLNLIEKYRLLAELEIKGGISTEDALQFPFNYKNAYSNLKNLIFSKLDSNLDEIIALKILTPEEEDIVRQNLKENAEEYDQDRLEKALQKFDKMLQDEPVNSQEYDPKYLLKNWLAPIEILRLIKNNPKIAANNGYADAFQEVLKVPEEEWESRINEAKLNRQQNSEPQKKRLADLELEELMKKRPHRVRLRHESGRFLKELINNRLMYYRGFKLSKVYDLAYRINLIYPMELQGRRTDNPNNVIEVEVTGPGLQKNRERWSAENSIYFYELDEPDFLVNIDSEPSYQKFKKMKYEKAESKALSHQVSLWNLKYSRLPEKRRNQVIARLTQKLLINPDFVIDYPTDIELKQEFIKRCLNELKGKDGKKYRVPNRQQIDKYYYEQDNSITFNLSKLKLFLSNRILTGKKRLPSIFIFLEEVLQEFIRKYLVGEDYSDLDFDERILKMVNVIIEKKTEIVIHFSGRNIKIPDTSFSKVYEFKRRVDN